VARARPLPTPAALPHPGRRERGKQEKLARIRAAARRLFARHGFERTTTREISAEADIGAGTLFLYAPTKEDLLVLIFEDSVGRTIDAAFASLTARPLLDQVLQIFDGITSYVAADTGLARVFVKEIPFVADGGRGVAHLMSQMNVRLSELVEVAKRRGEIDSEVPAKLLALNLFGSYFQYLQLGLAGRAPAPRVRDPRLRAALELQLRGARARSVGRRTAR
jgi:AcrR family transcriptional regulator